MMALTDEQQVAAFGDPRPHVRDDGSVAEAWPQAILTYVALPEPLPLAWDRSIKVTRFRCHRRIAGLMKAALDAIYRETGLWQTIGDFGGCYEFRRQRKASKLSRHSWATALDQDVGDNPMGGSPNVDPLVVHLFAEYGFTWGGLFEGPRMDPMHFEFANLGLLP